MKGRAESETKRKERKNHGDSSHSGQDSGGGLEFTHKPHNTLRRTHAHTQEDTKNMAFKCIAARPCDSHGVVSWELPPPLISLMDYNNRKLARPATSHHTTPTDNCCRNIKTQAEGTEQPFPHSRHLSITVFKSKFNPCKSVLCGAEESMAM